MSDIESERKARTQAVRFLLYPVIFSPDLALEADRVCRLFGTYPHDQIAGVIQSVRAELEAPTLQANQIEDLSSKSAEAQVRAYLKAVVDRLAAEGAHGVSMSELSYDATTAKEQAKAYVASILKALGSRDAMEVLAETPEALRRAVAGLTAVQDGTPERAGKWSVRQVVQHLADSELVGAFRFRMILAHDAPELPGYDQDLWASKLHYEDSDVATALADFTALRRGNLRLFRRAAPADLKRVMHHAERGDESLEQTIPLYAGHDLVHLAQIRRIRAAIGAPAPLPSPGRPAV